VSVIWSQPNQQAVRNGEPVMSESNTGDNPDPPLTTDADAASSEYDGWTKAELLDEAQSRGLSPANAAMTKDELVAALEGSD